LLQSAPSLISAMITSRIVGAQVISQVEVLGVVLADQGLLPLRRADRSLDGEENVRPACFLLFSVMQVAAFFDVRNIVAPSAADGARFAAAAVSTTRVMDFALATSSARVLPKTWPGSSGSDGRLRTLNSGAVRSKALD
jgi:hypothetical protein